MSVNYLSRGLEITLDGRQWIVENRTKDGEILLRDLLTHDFAGFAETVLFSKFFSNEAMVTPKNNSQAIEAMEVVDSIALASEPNQKAVEFRLKFVLPVERSGVGLCNHDEIMRVAHIIADELGVTCPSYSSIKRWVRAYRASGGDPRSLLPRRRPGNTRSKFGIRPKQRVSERDYAIARETYDVVNQVLAEVYMTRQRLSVTAVYGHLERRIQDLNRYRSEENRLPYPSLSSLYRAVSEIDPYELNCARYGKRNADQRHEQRGIGPRPIRPLERGEIDHTRLPLMVIDFLSRLPLGRPWLTTLIDKFSGAILGFYLSFESPGANSIMKCLEHAVKPKDFIYEIYPNIKNTYDCWGILETLACDNGMDFLSKHNERACLDMGTRIDFMPVRKPWYKAAIENHFGVINQKLLKNIPGKTFADIFEKEDYDPVANAVISFEALIEIIYVWIVDEYNQSVRRGYEQTGPKNIPAVTWREGIKERPRAMPSGVDFDIALRMVEERVLDASGIELFGLRYNDAALSTIRNGKGGVPVLVRYDSSDLGMIYVADMREGRYVPAPALDQAYARGLTVYQNKVLRRYLRENLRKEINRESLIAAKAYIQDIVDREARITKKIKSQTTIARYNKINSKNTIEQRRRSQMEAEFDINQPERLALPPAVMDHSVPEPETVVPESVSKPKKKQKSKSKSTAIEAEPVFENEPGEREEEFIETDGMGVEDIDDLDLDGWDADFGLTRGGNK